MGDCRQEAALEAADKPLLQLRKGELYSWTDTRGAHEGRSTEGHKEEEEFELRSEAACQT